MNMTISHLEPKEQAQIQKIKRKAREDLRRVGLGMFRNRITFDRGVIVENGFIEGNFEKVIEWVNSLGTQESKIALKEIEKMYRWFDNWGLEYTMYQFALTQNGGRIQIVVDHIRQRRDFVDFYNGVSERERVRKIVLENLEDGQHNEFKIKNLFGEAIKEGEEEEIWRMVEKMNSSKILHLKPLNNILNREVKKIVDEYKSSVSNLELE